MLHLISGSLDTEAVKPPETLWLHQEVGHNHSAAEELKKLLDGKVFESPKPKELIIKMLKLATYIDNDDIILDFFSGSASFMHLKTSEQLKIHCGKEHFKALDARVELETATSWTELRKRL